MDRWTLARGAKFLFWPRLSYVGVASALVFFVASVTPSLLPREWLFQGLVSGLCVAAGYSLGTAAAATARRLGVAAMDPATRQPAWMVHASLNATTYMAGAIITGIA